MPTTHDFTRPTYGHDYTFDPIDHGLTGLVYAWGSNVKVGDFLILRNGSGTTRYKVDAIDYYQDPPDMWKAMVVFAPRGNRND